MHLFSKKAVGFDKKPYTKNVSRRVDMKHGFQQSNWRASRTNRHPVLFKTSFDNQMFQQKSDFGGGKPHWIQKLYFFNFFCLTVDDWWAFRKLKCSQPTDYIFELKHPWKFAQVQQIGFLSLNAEQNKKILFVESLIWLSLFSFVGFGTQLSLKSVESHTQEGGKLYLVSCKCFTIN